MFISMGYPWVRGTYPWVGLPDSDSESASASRSLSGRLRPCSLKPPTEIIFMTQVVTRILCTLAEFGSKTAGICNGLTIASAATSAGAGSGDPPKIATVRSHHSTSLRLTCRLRRIMAQAGMTWIRFS